MDIILATKAFIKEIFTGEGSGHDWWHIFRVWKMSCKIAEQEGGNLEIIELAALLHDLDDWKLSSGGGEEPIKAVEWLQKNNYPKERIAIVADILKNISFKGNGVEAIMNSIEGKIVQDADRLDAIGAIGIARTFAYGGNKSREIYNPNILPENHTSFEEYKKSKGPTINHFHEKLLLLKDKMNTKTGKMLAEERHKYMLGFLNRFYKEWNMDI